jgi:aminopeptidase N
MKIYSVFLLFFWSFLAFGQSDFDVLHYDLNIILSKDSKQIQLTEALQIRLLAPTSHLKLDLIAPQHQRPGMKVNSVTAPYQNVKWKQTEEQLLIELPAQLQNGDIQLFIQMSGEPSDGLIMTDNKFGDPTYFADNWPNRARYWYACHDHPSDKATYQFVVQASKDLMVVANGNLLSKLPKENGASVVWTYRLDEPIATKVAVIGVAAFVSKEITVLDGIPISATVYPQDSVKALATFFEVAPKVTDFYINLLGAYAYPVLNNVQSTTKYGGMENAGCIFYDENSLNADLRSAHLVAHEIAHQWFGNAVTESGWPHLWLSEGFATYLTNIYIAHSEGSVPFLAQMAQDRKRVVRFGLDFNKPLVDSLTTDLNLLLNANAYQKGSWVLHMLRQEMGDSAFFEGLRAYYATYKHRNANSTDFCNIMIAHVDGLEVRADLNDFFEQWLYQVGHPKLKINNDNKQFLLISQVQQQLFSFPLQIDFVAADGTKERVAVEFTLREMKIAVPASIKGQKWTYIIDPGVRLLFEEVE